jgi:hypothetical protein
MKIFEEVNSDWFYMQLHMFKKGIIDKKELLNDEYVFDVRDNGVIVLRFDNTEDYFKLFDLNSYDVSTASQLFGSYYYEPEFYDYYTGNDDWNEGYILNYFNNENTEKLKKIVDFIAPNLDVNDRNEYPDICNVITKMFSKNVDYLVGDYTTEMNRAMISALRDSIRDDFCEKFQDEHIHKIDCFYKYITTVDNLIKLYDKLNCKSESLYDMLQKLGHEKHVDGDFTGYIYELNYHDEFDDESFNRDAKNFLDNVLESIEDSDEFINVDEYKRILKNLKKYKFDEWFVVPKSKTNYPMVKIEGIDPKTNYIIIKYKKDSGDAVEGSLSLEQFNNLLYHPELF